MDAASESLAGLVVSRETIQRLELFVAILQKWNPAINLVSKASAHDAWIRHVLDSAQIYSAAPANVQHWVDLGSGGGFPGLVLACIAAELQPQARFTLIEADQRKATFLRQAAQELNLKVQVLAQRIESTPPQAADVVSARALAPLDQLLSYAAWHLAPSGVGLFPKGTNFAAEVVDARKKWDFDIVVIPSKTEPAAAVLKVKDLKHV